MTCRGHVRAATRLARRRGVPYGSPRRRKLRIACDDFLCFASKVISRSLRCSSSPNRTRFAGLRFGFLSVHQRWADLFYISSTGLEHFSFQTKTLVQRSAAPAFKLVAIYLPERDHSNSIVPVGFGVKSYRTRFTPGTSWVMRWTRWHMRSNGMFSTVALMASVVFTARMMTDHSKAR